jgi:vacuolar-type H+-ATPase subunit I/STV1
MIKEIVKKAFNKQVKEWKTKDLRESFLNALAKARVPPEIRNVFVGNLRPKAQRGYGYTESALRPLYEEAFKFLSINGIGSQSRKLMELEQTFKTVMAKNREVFSNGIASLNEKIAELKEENKQLRQELANIETSLVAMETSQVTTDARLSNLTKRIGDVEENQRLGFDTKYLRDKKEEK